MITSVSFATHGKIKHAYLPSTINTLAFKDLQELTDLVLPSYENLETFVCRNSVVNALDIIKKSIKTLKTVTITGINWNLENTNILKVLAKLTGKDENEFNTDHSILTGTIHLPVIRDQELKEYIGTDEEKGIWTELEITYDSLIVQYKITCVNADKAHTVLDIQYVVLHGLCDLGEGLAVDVEYVVGGGEVLWGAGLHQGFYAAAEGFSFA